MSGSISDTPTSSPHPGCATAASRPRHSPGSACGSASTDPPRMPSAGPRTPAPRWSSASSRARSRSRSSRPRSPCSGPKTGSQYPEHAQRRTPFFVLNLRTVQNVSRTRRCARISGQRTHSNVTRAPPRWWGPRWPKGDPRRRSPGTDHAVAGFLAKHHERFELSAHSIDDYLRTVDRAGRGGTGGTLKCVAAQDYNEIDSADNPAYSASSYSACG